MTFKEWNASIMLAGQGVVSGWLVWSACSSPGWPGTVAEASTRLVWAVAFMVAFNVLASVVVTALVSVARREALRDEPSDERDRAIGGLAKRNAYFVSSAGGALSLLLLSRGVDPAIGAYALFSALMLGGATESVTKLVAYRVG